MSSLKEITEWCRDHQKQFWEYVLAEDMNEREVTKEASFAEMERAFDVMLETIHGYEEKEMSASGLVGGDGARLLTYRQMTEAELREQEKKPALCGDFMGSAMSLALKMAESNACMKRIVASPTAGSCGIIPAVFVTYYEMFGCLKEDIIKALFVAGGIGQVIADRASISGAEGGCQAEIGSASAMAAGGLAFLQGATNAQICDAVAISLKGMLGLVCDPVAGLVEVPCVKRNVIGCVNAISSTDMVLAGITSRIPADEVIDAMAEVGDKMDTSLKETAKGGLATTPTGLAFAVQMSEQ